VRGPQAGDRADQQVQAEFEIGLEVPVQEFRRQAHDLRELGRVQERPVGREHGRVLAQGALRLKTGGHAHLTHQRPGDVGYVGAHHANRVLAAESRAPKRRQRALHGPQRGRRVDRAADHDHRAAGVGAGLPPERARLGA